MGVDLDFVDVPGVGSNTWALWPSDDDAKDADNENYVLENSAADAVTKGLPADIVYRKDGSTPFYSRKQKSVADFHGSLELESGAPAIVLGTKAGGPVDLLSDADAFLHNVTGLPSAYVFYGLEDGVGTDLTMNGMKFASSSTATARSGLKFIESYPWENGNLVSIVQAGMIRGAYRTGVIASISAPVANEQTVTVYGTLSGAAYFTADDVGKTFTIFDSLKGENNGAFEISAYVSEKVIKILNRRGTADASVNCRWSIAPAVLPLALMNSTFDSCDFGGSFGNPILAYNGSSVSDVYWGINLTDNLFQLIEAPSQVNNLLDPGLEFIFAERSGKKYYWALTPAPSAGNTVIKDCTFSNLGIAYQVNSKFGEHAVRTRLSLPDGAPAYPTTEVDGNTIVDCGFSAWRASDPICKMMELDGLQKFNHNTISFTRGVRDPKNILMGVVCENGYPSLDGGETALFGGGTQRYAWPTNQVAQYANNDIDMGPASSGDKNPYIGMFFRGRPNSQGLPAGTFQSLVIANNRIAGKAERPLWVRSQTGVVIKYNAIDGRAEKQTIIIEGCPGYVCENNTPLNPGQAAKIYIDDKSTGSVKNALGTEGSGTVIAPSTTTVSGMVHSTDSTVVDTTTSDRKAAGHRRGM